MQPAGPARQAGDRLPNALEGLDDARQQGARRGRRPQPVRQAFEQRHTEMGLQQLHVAADGTRRHVQFRPGPRETAETRRPRRPVRH